MVTVRVRSCVKLCAEVAFPPSADLRRHEPTSGNPDTCVDVVGMGTAIESDVEKPPLISAHSTYANLASTDLRTWISGRLFDQPGTGRFAVRYPATRYEHKRGNNHRGKQAWVRGAHPISLPSALPLSSHRAHRRQPSGPTVSAWRHSDAQEPRFRATSLSYVCAR